MLKWDLCFVNCPWLIYLGLLWQNSGIGTHPVPPPAGQRKAGSLCGVTADPAAAPGHPAGDGLGLRQQPPALSHREEQPLQGESTSILLSMGKGDLVGVWGFGDLRWSFWILSAQGDVLQ